MREKLEKAKKGKKWINNKENEKLCIKRRSKKNEAKIGNNQTLIYYK